MSQTEIDLIYSLTDNKTENDIWDSDDLLDVYAEGQINDKQESVTKSSPISDITKQYISSTPWELQLAVSEWERGERDDIKYTIDPLLTEKREELAPGTCLGGPNAGKPIFQFIPLDKPFEEGGTKVAESTNCLSFIPAGFRDAETVNKMNPVREDIGGNSTLMSLVHVLTIPKKKRIYNASTLKKEDLNLIEEMKQLGEHSVNLLMRGSKDMKGSLKWVYSQDGQIKMKDGSQKSAKVITTDLAPKCQINYHKKIRNPTILNSFHVYPAASIGWLHLHSYVGELLTTAHESMEQESRKKGYNKNTLYDEVVKSIM